MNLGGLRWPFWCFLELSGVGRADSWKLSTPASLPKWVYHFSKSVRRIFIGEFRWHKDLSALSYQLSYGNFLGSINLRLAINWSDEPSLDDFKKHVQAFSKVEVKSFVCVVRLTKVANPLAGLTRETVSAVFWDPTAVGWSIEVKYSKTTCWLIIFRLWIKSISTNLFGVIYFILIRPQLKPKLSKDLIGWP